MNFIKVIEVEPKEGLVLKAAEGVDFSKLNY